MAAAIIVTIKALEKLGAAFLGLGMFVAWMAGIVIAKGAWSTAFAFFPFYAWYLVVEKAMRHWGWA